MGEDWSASGIPCTMRQGMLWSSERMMDAFPPAPEAQATLANWRKPPFNRWAFQHLREIVPTAEIAASADRLWELPRALRDLAGRRCVVEDREQGLGDWLVESHTDGLIVLADGTIVFEWYDNNLTPMTPHIVFSVTKSVTALVAGILADRRLLDPDAPVLRYIPEVEGSGYGDATVRDVLDMLVSLDFDEDYLAVDGAFQRYREAGGWFPVPDPGTAPNLRSFLATLARREGPHGKRFRYLSPNSDLLGWICERAAGRRFADLLSELLWQPMGAERSADLGLDREGAPRTAGGLAVTLRDLARVGELLRCRGVADGRTVVPGWWIDDILTAGDPAAWDGSEFEAMLPPGGRYRSQWYLTDGRGSQAIASGIHGQWIWIDRDRGVTIAKLSSQPLPTTDGYDQLELGWFEAIAATL